MECIIFFGMILLFRINLLCFVIGKRQIREATCTESEEEPDVEAASGTNSPPYDKIATGYRFVIDSDRTRKQLSLVEWVRLKKLLRFTYS